MEESTFNHTSFDSLEEEEYHGPYIFSTSNNVNRMLITYIDPIICVLGNILVILTVAPRERGKEPHKKFEVFQLNLAITNLLFIVALPFLIYNELFSWPRGQAACKLLHASYSINFYSGMLLMAGMSIVQLLAVNMPMKVSQKPINTAAIISCAFIWVFAILFSFPNFYFYHWYDPTSDYITIKESEGDNETSTPPRYVCEFRFEDSESSRMVKVAVPSIQMAVGFFLPLVIIVCSYTSIIIIIMKTENLKSNVNPLEKKEQVTHNVTGIILVFVVCHLPYNIVLLYDTVNMFQEVSCEVVDSRRTTLLITQTISYLQCILNPVVYGFRTENFRKKFSDVFRPSLLSCLQRLTCAHVCRKNVLAPPNEQVPLKPIESKNTTDPINRR